MNARERSLRLMSMLPRGTQVDADPEIDPFTLVDAPEPEHRSSLDAVLHEAGREWLGEGFLVRGR